MVSYKAFLLSITLLLALSISQSYAHLDGYECDHDSIEQNPGLLDIEEENHHPEHGRLLESSSYPNIRVYPYYEFIKSTAPSSYASYLINDLLPPVIDYFRAALKVKYPVSGNLKLSGVSKICERSTPSILTSTGVAADHFVYFDTQAVSGTQIAASKYCYLASGTKRPLISRVMINRNMLKVTNDVIINEQSMYTLLHEMIHSFGFSTYNFKSFLDDNGRTRSGHLKTISIGGSTRTLLDLPSLTQRIRNHFGCSTINGALMENSGGSTTAASHFERKIFVYEAMSSGSIIGRRITEFSLAVLEGSGWYVPNYDFAEPYFFGKGEGCSFITGTCSSSSSKFDDYCTGSSKGCAPTGRGGGYCNSDSLSENCRYYKPSVDYDCENDDADNYASLPSIQVFGRGAGSKCFTGTLSTRSSSSKNSFCFKYTCSGSGSSTQLQVQVGSNTITCTEEGQRTVNGYYGYVSCPDPQTFCTGAGKKYCPRNCMGRGTCVDNKCQCNSGYTGVDCAIRN